MDPCVRLVRNTPEGMEVHIAVCVQIITKVNNMGVSVNGKPLASKAKTLGSNPRIPAVITNNRRHFLSSDGSKTRLR